MNEPRGIPVPMVKPDPPDGGRLPDDASADDVRAIVREKYGTIAETGACGCDCEALGCCGTGDPAVSEQIGYSASETAAIPEESDLGLGCGNPLAFADARPGETVLDLGSGAGIDCFLAARRVGPTGHVIGVDMTPSMIERARAAAAKHGFSQVEFRPGEIEHLPVDDASVDLVISNCVVNLSPEKPRVFGEAFRVLKPGGRMVVSDLVLLRALTPEQDRSVRLLVGCIAGASLRGDYLDMIRAAGFADVEVAHESGYSVGATNLPEGSSDRAAFESVSSIKVRATKR
jgi:SAM-dependent methyltransferase